MPAVCTAISLQTDLPCKDPATSENGQFCGYHAKEVFQLYLHYKRRQADLETLEKNVPKCFPPRDWGNCDWTSYESMEELREIKEFLDKKWLLLNRCVLSRELHHKHFYNDKSDFGHESYLERLRTMRLLVVKALERLERRVLELRHNNEAWAQWVATLQAERDARQDAEKKKVKAEAALYRENKAKVEEIKKREQEKLKEEIEKREVWDPIDLYVEQKRLGYVTLLRFLLQNTSKNMDEEKAALDHARDIQNAIDGLEHAVKYTQSQDELIEMRQKLLKEGHEKKYMIRPSAHSINRNPLPEKPEVKDELDALYAEPSPQEVFALDDIHDEAYKKLIRSMNNLFTLERGSSSYVLDERESVYQKMLAESSAIQELLLIRFVAKQPNLINVALKCSSVDEFLNNSDSVRNSDLRDLVLNLSKASLIQIRHACADYFAANDKSAANNVKIKLCGRWIYKYESSRPMPREGWFQFALFSGCHYDQAREMCATWEEFRELELLVLNNYFSGLRNGWDNEEDGTLTQMYRRIGLTPYFYAPGEEEGWGRDDPRRKEIQTRAALFCIVGRKDYGARRFLTWAKTFSNDYLIWARDNITGKVIVKPEADQMWLARRKVTGKKKKSTSSDGKWEVYRTFNAGYKTEMDKYRFWKPAFKDYIEIVIWDRIPGREFTGFASGFLRPLNKAYKLRDQISGMEGAFDVYIKYAEADGDAERVELVQKVKEGFAELRATRENGRLSDEEKDEGTYYDPIDEEIDDTFGCYESNPIWNSIDPGWAPLSINQLNDNRRRFFEMGVPMAEYDNLQKSFDDRLAALIDAKGTEVFDNLHDRNDPSKLPKDPLLRYWDTLYWENEELRDWALEETKATVTKKWLLNDAVLHGQFVYTFCSMCLGVLAGGKEREEIVKVFQFAEPTAGGTIKELGDAFRELYRAKHPPPNYRPKEIPYEEFDKLVKEQGTEEDTSETKLPRAWRHEILRTVSQLFQDGAIVPSSEQYSYGTFCARITPDAPLKMYIDYRSLSQHATLTKIGRDLPTSPKFLWESWKAIQATKSATHFTLLRFASAHSHWYLRFEPEENVDTDAFAFADPYGRSWKWNRRPKDLPYSEDDQHEHLCLLLERAKFEKFAAAQVDRVLVWGGSRKECMERSQVVSMSLYKPAMGLVCEWSKCFVAKDRTFGEYMDERWWTYP